jgi:hypothetical protein
VLLHSVTHRKSITSITAVLLPFVTYLLTLPRIYGSRDISVSRENRLRAGRIGNRGMMPFMSYSSVIPFDVQFRVRDITAYCSSVRGKRRSLRYSIQTGSEVHPASYRLGVGVSVPRDKATSMCSCHSSLHLIRRKECVQLYVYHPSDLHDGRGSIPGTGKKFCLLHSVETNYGEHSASYSMGKVKVKFPLYRPWRPLGL